MMQKILLTLLTFTFLLTTTSAINIIEAGGALESVYVKWEPIKCAKKYNVSVKGKDNSIEKIDDSLIRKYDTYFRADIPGLKAGEYTVTVSPIIKGKLKKKKSATTDMLTAIAHERYGFAFSNNKIPGAYNADGTPKEGAVILYITDANKDSLSLEVKGATVNPCIGLQAIMDGFKKGKDNRPLIIRFIGQISTPAYTMDGDIMIENKKNDLSFITFEGIGDDAVIDGWGIRLKRAYNVEIRNLGFINCASKEGDNISLQKENKHIWVHNCDFFYGGAGDDTDQAKGDGALDCKKSTYVTFSYNHFWDSGKSNLLGYKEATTEDLYITYHHNWYDHSDSRHPRIRYYSAHVFNNYYDGNSKYGAAAMLGASAFVEANYFRKCKYPMEISMQGSDIFFGKSTFSKEDGGIIKAFNNYMTGQKRFIAYGDSTFENSTVEFDAFVVKDRNEKIDTTIVTKQGANTYNNFDTDSTIMYDYTADSPEVAKEKVIKYAGRLNGGDFKWTFNNEIDDKSSKLNKELKKAVVNYKTKLISIQGQK